MATRGASCLPLRSLALRRTIGLISRDDSHSSPDRGPAVTRPRRVWLCAPALLAAALGGCWATAPTPPADPPGWFRDVTSESGLAFTHDAGPGGRYFLPEIMGSGAAVLDFDNDGRLDVYLVHNGGPNGRKNQLFHREPDGTFKDVSAGS